MDVIRGLLTGDWFEYHGEIYDVPKIKQCPVPATHLPLIVGGHAELALKRAAVRGDGWIHGGGDQAELPGLITRLHELRADSDRSADPFEVHVISMEAYTVDGIRRLEEMGVTDVIVGFRWTYQREQDAEPLQDKVDALRRYADTVIAASR
jgi:alkanesulfonate monooxygenase SsuD/methylene tetrahydromethanopterin reductase-like flavin-dependent oxidoreductase (luciferase family)